MQSVVSGDAIIQASATIIVGMIFLVTLRKALRLSTTASDLRPLWYAAILLVLACYASFFMENPIYTVEAHWWFGALAMTFFNAGLLVVAFTIYKIVREKSDREQTENVGLVKVWKANLKTAGIEIDRDRKYMKECVSCDKLIPLASETCQFCQIKQEQSKASQERLEKS